MINLSIILGILFLHWVGDFVLQTDWQATNKSKNNLALTSHVASYSIVWTLASLVYSATTGNWWMLLFVPITFVCHWITDYYTSRINSKLWADKKVHYFFVSIGFDQFLHYAQLLITFAILSQL